jgi:hypothetical protein
MVLTMMIGIKRKGTISNTILESSHALGLERGVSQRNFLFRLAY